MGWLAGKGKEVAVWIGLGLAFILLSYGGYTFFKLIRDVPGNAVDLVASRAAKGEVIALEAAERSIQYKAGVFAAMAFFSITAFLRLGLSLRRGGTA
jgi:hypothetical protein